VFRLIVCIIRRAAQRALAKPQALKSPVRWAAATSNSTASPRSIASSSLRPPATLTVTASLSSPAKSTIQPIFSRQVLVCIRSTVIFLSAALPAPDASAYGKTPHPLTGSLETIEANTNRSGVEKGTKHEYLLARAQAVAYRRRPTHEVPN